MTKAAAAKATNEWCAVGKETVQKVAGERERERERRGEEGEKSRESDEFRSTIDQTNDSPPPRQQ